MNDPDTLRRVIAKCEQTASQLERRGCSAQARVASDLAASFKSMASGALPGPVGYLHADGQRYMPAEVFLAWSKLYGTPQTVAEYQPVYR